jgi:hypothetical protein
LAVALSSASIASRSNQETGTFADWASTLAVSGAFDGTILLLNPNRTFEVRRAGSLVLANWLPGMYRFVSF